MNRFLCKTLTSAIISASFLSLAGPSTEESDALPVLAQESQHAAAAKRVSALFTRSHYKEIVLNDALSGKIYDKYIKALDSGKNLFLKDEIIAFEKYRAKFDDALTKGDLSVAYDMFNLSQQQRVERYEYALTLLDKGFDFSKEGDVFFFDRDDADWPSTAGERDELWRQRIKYDALNLSLADKTPEEVKDLLSKRYERTIKRIKQTKSEDVFQTVMNSFARSIEAHTSYLSPRNAERFQMEMNLEFEGIGAVLQLSLIHI